MRAPCNNAPLVVEVAGLGRLKSLRLEKCRDSYVDFDFLGLTHRQHMVVEGPVNKWSIRKIRSRRQRSRLRRVRKPSRPQGVEAEGGIGAQPGVGAAAEAEAGAAFDGKDGAHVCHGPRTRPKPLSHAMSPPMRFTRWKVVSPEPCEFESNVDALSDELLLTVTLVCEGGCLGVGWLHLDDDYSHATAVYIPLYGAEGDNVGRLKVVIEQQLWGFAWDAEGLQGEEESEQEAEGAVERQRQDGVTRL